MRLVRTTVVLLAVVLGLVACSGGSGGMSEGADSGGAEADMAADTVAASDDNGAREVVTTGSIDLVVPEPIRAMDEIVGLVEDVGGRVEARSEQVATDEQDAYGWLTVRVPSAELTATIDGVKELGEATDVSLTSEDVTRQGRDLDARITALEASTERLLTLLAEADSSETLFAAEDALSSRQGELEALQSERAYLSEQVAMSSLHISVSADQPVQLEAGGFLGGLQDGWRALVGFAGGLLVVLGAILPWLVVVGVPLAVGVVLVRRRRRSAAPPPDAAPA